MQDVMTFIKDNIAKTVHFNTEDDGTLLGLPYPYTTPCIDDTFLEMYYWDTYFTNIGLFLCGMEQQAKNNVDNILYMVEKYGFMPNGNRTYYLNRSQPPFLYAMVDDIYEKFGDKEWLKNAFLTLKKEYAFWQTKRLADNGLNFYGNFEDITDEMIEHDNNAFKARSGGFETDDIDLRLAVSKTMSSFEESGWDCTSRFEIDGEHYNPVDLNCLMYGFETTMSKFSKILDNDEENLWKSYAESRKKLIQKFLWNDEKKIYMDWNFKDKRFSPIESMASLYALFVGLCDDEYGSIELLKKLILEYGVSASLKENCKYQVQWDYPNVWAPLQFIAFKSCKKYGYDSIADTIADKYIRLIDEGFKNTGNIWEKYDGNTGEIAGQDYAAPTMMGWTAGVYVYFKKHKNEL